MANTVTQQSSIANYKTDPLRAFKFHVIINTPILNATNAATNVALGFMSVSGLGVQTDIISYRQGGYNTALTYSAPILTVDGWKCNGDIEIGDRVIDPYGQDSKVVGIYPAGIKDIYTIALQDGSEADACWGHLWEVVVHGVKKVVSTLELKGLIECPCGSPVLMPKIRPLDLDDPDAKPEMYHVPVVSVTYAGQEAVQCLEVSADSHLFVTYEYMASHNTTNKMPGQSDYGPVVLQKGIICGDANMIDWLRTTFLVQQGTGNWDNSQEFRANVDILVLDHPVTAPTVAVKAAFRIYNAFPTQVSFNDLDAANNMFLVSQMTLAHEGWDVNIATAPGPSATAAIPN